MNKKLLAGLMSLTLVLTACSTGSKNDKDSMESNEEKMTVEANVDEEAKEKVEENKSVMTEVKNDGPMAFDFELQDLEGNMYKLSDQKGKKVLVKYWASWCPICLAGLSEFDEMSKDTEDYDIVSVVSPGNIGEKEKDDFIEWFNSLDYKNMKVLLDESGKFIEDYGIRSAPTHIVVGSDGVLVSVIPGQLNKEAVDKIFEEVQ